MLGQTFVSRRQNSRALILAATLLRPAVQRQSMFMLFLRVVRCQWSVVRCVCGVSTRLKLNSMTDNTKNNGQLTTDDGQFLGDQPPAYCFADSFRLGMDVKFFVDAADVVTYGVETDV